MPPLDRRRGDGQRFGSRSSRRAATARGMRVAAAPTSTLKGCRCLPSTTGRPSCVAGEVTAIVGRVQLASEMDVPARFIAECGQPGSDRVEDLDVVRRSDVGHGQLLAADTFEQRSHQWNGILVRAGVRQTVEGIGSADAEPARQRRGMAARDSRIRGESAGCDALETSRRGCRGRRSCRSACDRTDVRRNGAVPRSVASPEGTTMPRRPPCRSRTSVLSRKS